MSAVARGRPKYDLRTATQTQGTPRSGKFAIRYWYVPPPGTFDLGLGAVVAADQPGPGAGTLERPGAADEYRLTVGADGTVLHVHVNEYDPPLDLIPWEITDSGGQRVALKCLGCGADEDVELPSSGAFVLRVGTLDRDAGVGPYSLAVSAVRARD
jgi:hypothetical protein